MIRVENRTLKRTQFPGGLGETAHNPKTLTGCATPREPHIKADITPRKGRPRIEDKGKSFEATKPWEALGMSRRTWYSRQAEKRKERASAIAHPGNTLD